MEPIMKEYCELVGFLGKVLGQDYEIILHDLSNMDHSVIAVANGHVSGRRIGSPMNENGLRLIRSGAWKDNPEMIRYRGYSKKSNQLLCFARFIKNQEGEPIGMLCINYDYTNSQKLVDSLTETAGYCFPAGQAESEKYFKSDTENSRTIWKRWSVASAIRCSPRPPCRWIGFPRTRRSPLWKSWTAREFFCSKAR